MKKYSFFRKINKLLPSLRKRGGWNTVKLTFSYFVDYLFDIIYQIETFSIVNVEELGINEDILEHTVKYQPTHVLPLRKLFRNMNIRSNSMFVDIGCGKGKVLLVASEFNFNKVIGIEISEALCKIAEKNIATYKQKCEFNSESEIINIDARDYSFCDNEEYFYMYNPFDEFILVDVLSNILHSLHRNKRKIWIIYRFALYQNIIENMMQPISISQKQYWGADFTIFEIQLH